MKIETIMEVITNLRAKVYVTTGEPANYTFKIGNLYVVWEDENISCPTEQEFLALCNGCDLVCCKDKQKTIIQNAWQDEVDEGFTHGDNTFDFDDTTFGIVGARLAYNESVDTPTTADLTFYNTDKVAVVFADKTAFKAFAIDFIVARNSLDQKRVALKAQINACSTVEDVEAVTW